MVTSDAGCLPIARPKLLCVSSRYFSSCTSDSANTQPHNAVARNTNDRKKR